MINKEVKLVKVDNPSEANCVLIINNQKTYFKIVVEDQNK
jgi:hypothetical protein